MKKFLTTLVFVGSLLGGCDNPNKDNEVYINVSAPVGLIDPSLGRVSFEYKEMIFHDEGFDGTLDRVVDSGGEIRLGDKGFDKYVPLYMEAREIATYGLLGER